MHKKFQIDWTNIDGVMAIIVISSLMAKNGTKKTFQTSRFSIAISRYLEAEIDYRYFILFCRVVFQDYAQEVSSQLD